MHYGMEVRDTALGAAAPGAQGVLGKGEGCARVSRSARHPPPRRGDERRRYRGTARCQEAAGLRVDAPLQEARGLRPCDGEADRAARRPREGRREEPADAAPERAAGVPLPQTTL